MNSRLWALAGLTIALSTSGFSQQNDKHAADGGIARKAAANRNAGKTLMAYTDTNPVELYATRHYNTLKDSALASPSLKQLLKWTKDALPMENQDHYASVLMMGNFINRHDTQSLQRMARNQPARQEVMYQDTLELISDALYVAIYSKNMREKEVAVDITAGLLTALEKGIHAKDFSNSERTDLVVSGLNEKSASNVMYISHIMNHVLDVGIDADRRAQIVGITQKIGNAATTNEGLKRLADTKQRQSNSIERALGICITKMLGKVQPGQNPIALRYAPASAPATGNSKPIDLRGPGQ